MSELSDFLLACFAEDEAVTWTLSPYECPPGCCAPAGWVGVQCRYCDPAPVYGGTVAAMTASAEEHAEAIHQRSRVLAKCEADRRIVLLADAATPPDLDPVTEHHVGNDGPWVGSVTLKLLALPYASHPDYREEWRP